MLTGDLDRLLAAQFGHAVTPQTGHAGTPRPAGAVPEAGGITSAGTWRPGPPGGTAGPGTYATPVAFTLARTRGTDPASTAAALAAVARQAGWVREATVTGGGYLTVTVTAETLARVAVRIATAGPVCARSTALAGAAVSAPPDPDLAAAASWEDARRRLAAHLTGRLAEAAGARTFSSFPAKRCSVPGRSPRAPGPVAVTLDYAGADAVRFALARLPPGAPAQVDPCHAAAHRADVPAYAVRYAHAHAVSALRHAADLGLGQGDAAGFQPRSLAHPSERALLGELSWLPERVAGAARRNRPDVFPRYLERLASAYFDCQEQRPAAWPGMTAGCADIAARLWLAAATATALRAGLGLLGVGAPDRL